MGIKFHNTKILKKIKFMIKATEDLSYPLMRISHMMKIDIQTNFDKQQSYDGIPWKRSKRAILQGGVTLKNTGRLYGSFKYKSGKNFARVGTNVKYARTLNQGVEKGEFGTKTITVKTFKRRVYKLTKKGKKSKRATKVQVKEHQRTINIPWGDIPGYKFMGISEQSKEKYIEEIKDFILKKGYYR